MVPFSSTMQLGERAGVHEVRLCGRLETAWADEVRRLLLHTLGHAASLDVSGLTFIDARGVDALVAVRQEVVADGGRFHLSGATGEVRAAFAALGVDALVDDDPRAPDSGDDARSVPPVVHLPARGGQQARRRAHAPKVA